MSEPRPPATPPNVPADATGEWSAITAPEPPAPDSPTLTNSGQGTTAESFGIPNPFGRYSVDRLLGRGGMGAVFLAHDPQLDRPVALKIPSFGGTITDGQKERFFREARAIAALRHPNICPVYDVDEETGTLYLTMAYIDGHTLAAKLRDGPLEQNEAAELISRVALGMQAAHEHGTIHRDLKPANIMIDPEGEPVVMDFGLARKGDVEEEVEPGSPLPSRAEVGLTQMGSVLGTPAYMPPEQAVGDLNAIGPRSDVYSLGAVFYECLTGRRPFDGPDTSSVIQKILHVPPTKPRDIVEGINPSLERVCLKAMAKRPEDRYPSMEAFAEAIKNVIDPELTPTEPPPLPPAGGRSRRKRRRWVTPVIILSVALLLVGICVGGPTAAIYFLINKVKDSVKEFSESQQLAEKEWELIMAHWQPPPEDADANTLFPASLREGYHRIRVGEATGDAELGINLTGQRAVYSGSSGQEFEVNAYRCPENEARAIEDNVEAFVRRVQSGQPGSGNRKKAIYSVSNSGQRSVTFGFATDNVQNQEFGKLWYSQGWLFHFKTSGLTAIESFPSKYLLEVDKQAGAPKKDGKKPERKAIGRATTEK
jgi:serine/threonine protein kinase